MKHNTHIYLAAKAIELSEQAVSNTVDARGHVLSGARLSRLRRQSKTLLRMLRYYQGLITEASWAPDDVLHDNDPYHIFKLFTAADFPGFDPGERLAILRDGVTYYKFAGGLPYRIDHLAHEIVDMQRLREFNDHYSREQIFYKYLLMSHYIVDAHVPMHCDLRDDPPSSRSRQASRSKKHGKPNQPKRYLKGTAHAMLEKRWDDAVTPVAIDEGLIQQSRLRDKTKRKALSPAVSLGLDDAKKGGCVRVKTIKDGKLAERNDRHLHPRQTTQRPVVSPG